MVNSDYLSMNILVKQIGEWGAEAFPGATLESILAHFGEEVQELSSEVNACDYSRDLDAIAEEIADCFLLMSQLAYKLEIDLADAVVDKLARNKSRRWSYDPALGYSKHDEEQGDAMGEHA